MYGRGVCLIDMSTKTPVPPHGRPRALFNVVVPSVDLNRADDGGSPCRHRSTVDGVHWTMDHDPIVAPPFPLPMPGTSGEAGLLCAIEPAHQQATKRSQWSQHLSVGTAIERSSRCHQPSGSSKILGGRRRQQLPKRMLLECRTPFFLSRFNQGVPTVPSQLTLLPTQPPSTSSLGILNIIPRTPSRPTPGVRIIPLLSWGNVCETRRTSTLRIQGLHRVRGWGYDMERLVQGGLADDARIAASNLLHVGV